MSVPKKHGHRYKNQASVAAFGLSRPSFLSGDEEFLAPPKAANKSAGHSNPGPSLALFQIPKYIDYDLQQILKTLLEV